MNRFFCERYNLNADELYLWCIGAGVILQKV